MPLRFSLSAHHLRNFSLTYTDTTFAHQNLFTTRKTIADEIACYFVLGGEFLLSKNLVARAGYNNYITLTASLNVVFKKEKSKHKRTAGTG